MNVSYSRYTALGELARCTKKVLFRVTDFSKAFVGSRLFGGVASGMLGI